MQRAALYARVSTEMQEKEQTIQSQLAAISLYAESHRFLTNSSLTYVDEGFSGSHLERPALDELRDHAREGRFDVVVVLCPDRLARKYAYQVLILEEFKRAGVEVHFCERPITDSPDDQLLLQIQGSVAEYERAKILERARRGRLHRARLGELGLSRLPYGYRYSPKKYGGDGRIRVDEEEAALVRQTFEWYALEGETLYGLLGRLNASSWRTRAGRKEWGATTVLRMLHCEWYVGRAYYNRTRTVRNSASTVDAPGKRIPKSTTTLRPETEWILVPVLPIVEEELFARVQQRIEENRRFARRRLRREGVYLLRGLVKCGLCGHAYVAETRQEERQNPNRSPYYYEYYICSMRMAPLPNAVRHCCANARLRAAGVDEAVWTAVRDLLLDSDEVATQLQHWVEQTNPDSPDLQKRLRQCEHRLQELTRQQNRLLDAYQIGALPLDTFRTRMQVLEEDRLSAELALAQVRVDQLTGEVAQARVTGAKTVLEQLRPGLLHADFSTRQQILRLLIERVVVHDQRLEVQLALPVSGNFDLTSKEPAGRQRLFVAHIHLLLANPHRPCRWHHEATTDQPAGKSWKTTIFSRRRESRGERLNPQACFAKRRPRPRGGRIDRVF